MDDLYQRIERAITPKTRLIHFCHITNRTGQIFPVRRICQMARARGIPTIVDGAHAVSHFPFQIADLDCDYYGTSLHKWTYAPIGTGFLYVRKSRIASTWSLMASAKGRVLPAERLGKQKTSWQIVTVIFFLALLSAEELRYAGETSTWWLRAWHEAGPILVWITVALTVYSGLGFTWRNRELIAPDQ